MHTDGSRSPTPKFGLGIQALAAADDERVTSAYAGPSPDAAAAMSFANLRWRGDRARTLHREWNQGQVRGWHDDELWGGYCIEESPTTRHPSAGQLARGMACGGGWLLVADGSWWRMAEEWGGTRSGAAGRAGLHAALLLIANRLAAARTAATASPAEVRSSSTPSLLLQPGGSESPPLDDSQRPAIIARRGRIGGQATGRDRIKLRMRLSTRLTVKMGCSSLLRYGKRADAAEMGCSTSLRYRDRHGDRISMRASTG